MLSSNFKRYSINLTKQISSRNTLKCASRLALTSPVRVGLPKYYSSSTQSSNKQLKQILKQELEISNSMPNELDGELKDYVSNNGFEIIETEGKSNVQLVKTLETGEIIRVFFDIDEVTDVPLNEKFGGEGEEGLDGLELDDELNSLDSLLCSVKVLIEKPNVNDGLFLNLFLQSSESALLIDSINYKSDAKEFLENSINTSEFLDKVSYQGPRFSELDESVQTGFESYLDSKGINNELADFVIGFSEFKEEKEYRTWLGDLVKFFK